MNEVSNKKFWLAKNNHINKVYNVFRITDNEINKWPSKCMPSPQKCPTTSTFDPRDLISSSHSDNKYLCQISLKSLHIYHRQKYTGYGLDTAGKRRNGEYCVTNGRPCYQNCRLAYIGVLQMDTGGAAATKFPTKYFPIELCAEMEWRMRTIPLSTRLGVWESVVNSPSEVRGGATAPSAIRLCWHILT